MKNRRIFPLYFMIFWKISAGNGKKQGSFEATLKFSKNAVVNFLPG